MSMFFGLVVAGAVSGALYAIMASGLVLTYSTSGVFNFAQGAIAFVAAVIYFELHSGAHLAVLPSALIAIVVFCPLCGLALDRIMFRGLASAGSTAQIVATVGLSIALPALAIWVVERLISLVGLDIPSTDNVVAPPGVGPVPPEVIHLTTGVYVNTDELATLSAAVLCAVGLWFVTAHTPLGLRMRAVVDQRRLATLRGINADRTSGIAWAIGTMLAGLAGVLGAPILGLGSTDFTLLMLVSACAAVFARLRSIPIAFVGGLALGVIENLVAGYVNPRVNIDSFSSAVPFMLLFLGLLLLNRRRGASARVPSDEKAPPTHDADLSVLRRAGPWVVAVAALLVYVLFIADPYWVGLVTSGLCLAVVFLSFVVVTGTGGMISLAQAAFVTVAALTCGLLISHHVPFLLALLAGTATATAIGIVVALPALRLGGVPLALATLALAFIGDLVLFQIPFFNNNNVGWIINRPKVGPIDLHSNKTMAVIVLIIVGLIVLVVRNLNRSSTGRAIFAVRSSETASSASGISSVRTKLLLFSFSAAIAGFGGILYATYSGAVTASDYPTQMGIIWLAVMVTFGVRRPGYAVIAGLVYALLPQVISWFTASTVLPQIFFGLGGIGLAKSPDGFLAEWKMRARERRRRAAAREERVVSATDGTESVAVPASAPAAARAGRSGNGGRVGGPEADDVGQRQHAVLELADIHAGYGPAEVVHGASITLRAGSLLGLLGANGAGKSTLSLVAAGALSPSGGQVRLDGDEITAQPAYWRRRHGIVLAPEARSVFPSLTVEENLRVQLDSPAARDALYERFGLLAERRRTAAGLLSGGEQRLLSLAPLLIEPPRVLIADEPSLGLAPMMVREIYRLFDELRREGVALLVVEEKMRDITEFADDLALMEVGHLEWLGSREEVDPKELASRYLRARL